MFRFLLFLFGKNYEPCKSCQTYKEQLDYERSNNRELTSTLLNLITPKVIEQPPTQELKNFNQTAGLWSRRRRILEQSERADDRIKTQSTILGKQDNVNTSVEALEKELDIQPEEGKETEGVH